MTTQNSVGDLLEAEVKRLRAEAEELTSQIPSGAKLQLGQIIEFVEGLGGLKLKQHRVRRLQRMHLLSPEKSARGYFEYSREDLRDLLVICRLEQEFDVPDAQMGGLLLEEVRNKLAKLAQSKPGQRSPADQPRRAHLFWRSHLLMVLLAWVFDGTIPRFARVLIRKEGHRDQSECNGEVWVEAQSCEFTEISDILCDVREGDITAVTTEDREALHKLIDWEEWKQYHNIGFAWYYLKVGIRQSSTSYRVVIGVPGSGIAGEIQSVWDTQAASLLLNLLAAYLQEVQSIPMEIMDYEHTSTRLHTIVSMIPDLSTRWEYSTVLVPDPLDAERLNVTVSSPSFPLESYKGLQVALGQLLSGWVYQNNQPLIVQRAFGERDPRVAHHSEERIIAAAAVPTLIHGKPNGVLYVGARKAWDGEVFSDIDIQFLRIVGRIVGELVELERMRLDVGQEALEIIREPAPQIQDWKLLREDITRVVDDLAQSKTAQVSRDNLHLMAVRISNYTVLQKHSTEVADWVVAQIRSTAYYYYLEHKLGLPVLYDQSPDRFVLLLRRVSMDDAGEQTLRQELRSRLNSMSLLFDPTGPSVSVECELWSLPFRYNGLFLRLEQIGPEELVQELVQKTERAFSTLPFIELGHQLEKRGAWEKALEQYELARTVDPESIYIWRHIAKARTRVYDYEGAVRWWWRVVDAHRHPSHYRRLAYNLACLGELDQAADLCESAIALDDHDAQCYAEWGNVLCQLKRYEEALEKFRKAALFDPSNRATYLRRMAEAHFALGEYRDALNACVQALNYESDNPDIPFWIMRVCQAMAEKN